MKKVGIVSCYFKNNYGSMLQAYASQKILDDNNIPNETINISKLSDFSKGKKKYYLSQITNFHLIKAKLGMVKLKIYSKINKKLKKNFATRNKRFEEFKKNFNLTRSFNTYKELNEYSEKVYSDVIVGSDQLWLPVNVVSDYYTLNWVPDSINRISYATSFGISSIPKKYKGKYKYFLNRIDSLSVRENSAVNLVKDVAQVDAKVVCDPTLLLTKEEWMDIQSETPILKGKYIFCYFLGKNIEHRRFAERLKEKTGYKIVSINHCDEYVKYSDKFADIVPYDVGPSEFINYIRNAEYVCTDSFHGTVFSLINNTKFFTFERFSKKSKMSTNSRIYSLLEIVDLKSRLISKNGNIDELINDDIDFDKVNKRLDKFRKESKEWLLSSIKWEADRAKHINIDTKEECCGCTACMNICPKNAIELVEDNEGFKYPKIDKAKCINCGLCKKVCPVYNKQTFNTFEQKAYLFQNKNEDVRSTSTSGGFYTSIGEYVIDNGGVVYGAAFDNDFRVKHEKATSKNELTKFRKSKYVQSNLNRIFTEVKNDLEDDKLVVFSGTPCQVAGIVKFLRRDYDNLILIDVMCHSVPSPLVFEKYKEYILDKMKASKITGVDFRDKSKYGYKYSMMTIKTDNGIYSQGVDTDPYLRAFFNDYSVRPSCYNCKFKTQKRVSDITIWDCYDVGEINKSFDDDKGTTRILVQSQKGLNILKKLDNVRIEQIELKVAVSKVREMTHSVSPNKNRNDFFKKLNSNYSIGKYFPVTIKTRINKCIRRFLSVIGIYTPVKKLAKKLLRK